MAVEISGSSLNPDERLTIEELGEKLTRKHGVKKIYVTVKKRRKAGGRYSYSVIVRINSMKSTCSAEVEGWDFWEVAHRAFEKIEKRKRIKCSSFFRRLFRR